jgi:hypothetical protein
MTTRKLGEANSRTVRFGWTDPSNCPHIATTWESSLVLLQRRLDEREAPVRIRKTGRGRFRLELESALELIEENS